MSMLTTKDVATDMGVGLTTVRKWIDEGALIAVKLGHVVRIDEEDYKSFKIAARQPKAALCHTDKKALNIGTSISSNRAVSRLDDLLGPRISNKRKPSSKNSDRMDTKPERKQMGSAPRSMRSL